MAGNSSPTFACGQVIFSLKMSNLNYIVKETPFSAFITIRKKFIKPVDDSQVAIENHNKHELVNDSHNREIISLKEKNRKLECEIAQSRFDYDENELKCESLKNEKQALEDQIEEVFTEKREIKKELKISKQLNSELKESNKKTLSDKDRMFNNLEAKCTKLEIVNKEKSDETLMLEFTLANRDEEIERLKTELDKSNYMTTLGFACDECAQKFETENDLNAHMKSIHTDSFVCEDCAFAAGNKSDLTVHQEKIHSKYCQDCKFTFVGERKLKKHVCRIKISNPCSGSFYTKDWFEKDHCVRVFDNATKTEKYLLHCDHCLSTQACQELPEKFHTGKLITDTQDVTHLEASIYLKLNTVNWRFLSETNHIMNISNMVLKR